MSIGLVTSYKVAKESMTVCVMYMCAYTLIEKRLIIKMICMGIF